MRRATARGAAFDADWLAPRLARLVDAGHSGGPRFLVAWSGGADSTALLAALCELRDRQPRAASFSVRALHVDHGLQAQSRDWVRHCRAQARRLRVPFVAVRVAVALERGLSREAAARDARYRAFEAALKPGEMLLLAQHADDQLETVLLQLLRGAGPAGLAAMPERRALGQGCAARPLLEAHPADLRAYLAGATARVDRGSEQRRHRLRSQLPATRGAAAAGDALAGPEADDGAQRCVAAIGAPRARRVRRHAHSRVSPMAKA